MKLSIPDRGSLRRAHDKLRGAGGDIAAVFYLLLDRDDGCACRKPYPGLLPDFAPKPGCV